MRIPVAGRITSIESNCSCRLSRRTFHGCACDSRLFLSASAALRCPPPASKKTMVTLRIRNPRLEFDAPYSVQPYSLMQDQYCVNFRRNHESNQRHHEWIARAGTEVDDDPPPHVDLRPAGAITFPVTSQEPSACASTSSASSWLFQPPSAKASRPFCQGGR